MNVRFSMDRGHAFLGGRGTANSVRVAAERALREHPDAVVTLDFSGVRGVSHSFSDELLAPLHELLGASFPSRIVLLNCLAPVQETMELVCEMHDLPYPAFKTDCAAA